MPASGKVGVLALLAEAFCLVGEMLRVGETVDLGVVRCFQHQFQHQTASEVRRYAHPFLRSSPPGLLRSPCRLHQRCVVSTASSRSRARSDDEILDFIAAQL